MRPSGGDSSGLRRRDGVCAAVGTGCVKEGIAHSCMGTSSWISITTKEPVYDEEMRTFTWAHIVPGYVLPHRYHAVRRRLYELAKNTLCQYEGVLASSSRYPLRHLRAGDQSFPVGAKGLLFLPYLIGERSPRWNPHARGAFVGLTMEHTKDDIVRAVQEGVALNLGVVMDCFKKKGVRIDEMTLIGGGAKAGPGGKFSPICTAVTSKNLTCWRRLPPWALPSPAA